LSVRLNGLSSSSINLSTVLNIGNTFPFTDPFSPLGCLESIISFYSYYNLTDATYDYLSRDS